ncbi:MAG: T9SS type A sorting domain-containing protein [Bacteroidetes bacterium]|nr:MAG: T9SS type A sorting domain-containing protein [Bacteroidota bacterium]
MITGKINMILTVPVLLLYHLQFHYNQPFFFNLKLLCMKKLNCNVCNDDIFRKVFSPLVGIACFLLFMLINNKSNAQDPSLNCGSGCTAKDIQIQKAYLVQTNGSDFPANFSCNAGDVVNVKLALDLTTSTPRVGVYIFANIRNSSTNAILGVVSECFPTPLASTGTTKVVFSTVANWNCGIGVKLTDVYIAWGTGNTDFCAGSSAPRCPATKSKCFLLPPGEFIPIVIPVGLPATATQCSTNPGGTTSVFNLHNLDATILNGQSGTVTYYTNSTLTTAIAPNESAYTSASATVYAKITNGGVSSSAISVTLTVIQTPNLSITNPAAVCSPNTVNITAAGVTAGSTGMANTTLSYWTNANGTGSVATPSAVGAGTYYIKATSNTTQACSDIKAVTVTVNLTPANPTVGVTQPTCANANGTVTVTSPLDGGGVDYEYSNNGGTYQDAVAFTVAAGAGYSITVRNKNGQCVSTGAASGTMGAQPQTPSVPAATVIQPTCTTATGTINVTGPDATITYTLTGPSPAVTTQSNTTGSFPGLAPGSYGLTATKNGCTSGSVSKTVNPQPAAPSFTVCLVQPTLCANSGSVTVNATGGSGFTYKLNNGAPQGSNVFSNLASGSVTSITVTNSDGCSAVVNCASLVESCPPAGRAANTTVTSESTLSPTTVKAYPNPFSDRVKFMVTSAVAGNGNLEIYNMMGQKVKTVYQGYIAAGTQTFELSLPGKQVANLVYVLRVGDKKVTGKILQMNQ